MDKGAHIFLQDIDLKDNKIVDVGSVSKGDNSISFGASDISLSSESVVIKSGETDVMSVTEEQSSITTDNFDVNGNVSFIADESSSIELTDESLDINSPKVSIKDSNTLEISSEDADGNSYIKSDISESEVSKTKEIVVNDEIKIIVDNGSLCFIRKE